ncbi:hypothetical protein CAPN001_13670 [Capnocytophaga stomatis]|uniref:Uncharacterized protein n=1 Tax=Capnocytophaga stomatis TaxID=1848904 RepID=A0A250FVW5_9FLAO|nr:hypothetical protein [Capnocytophaga stomatis]ATA89204.1 hypothetical protein CGC58_05380 [Capnocytophaga stomatis]GIJ96798.1 hypothetical protein CAPN001_13670 [Capnocytophaga stomatis]
MQELKKEIYLAISEFLEAYKAKDFKTLAEKFDICGEFLEEIYEMLDFVEDPSNLRIFPIEEMQKQVSGQDYLDVFNYDESSKNSHEYGIECVFFEGKEHLGYIIADYRSDNHFPKLNFKYFSV